jgi:hypothetical protein
MHLSSSGVASTIRFTKTIPRPIFDVIVWTYRYQWRVSPYALFLREQYPPFDFTMSADDTGGDPATLSISYPVEFNRWAPLYKWLLAIPTTSCSRPARSSRSSGPGPRCSSPGGTREALERVCRGRLALVPVGVGLCAAPHRRVPPVPALLGVRLRPRSSVQFPATDIAESTANERASAASAAIKEGWRPVA